MLLKIRIAMPTKVNVTRFSALNKLNYNRPIKYDANFRRIVSKILPIRHQVPMSLEIEPFLANQLEKCAADIPITNIII